MDEAQTWRWAKALIISVEIFCWFRLIFFNEFAFEINFNFFRSFFQLPFGY